eukprot:15365705-Ditylum_brightwellii.AAC.2
MDVFIQGVILPSGILDSLYCLWYLLYLMVKAPNSLNIPRSPCQREKRDLYQRTRNKFHIGGHVLAHFGTYGARSGPSWSVGAFVGSVLILSRFGGSRCPIRANGEEVITPLSHFHINVPLILMGGLTEMMEESITSVALVL